MKDIRPRSPADQLRALRRPAFAALAGLFFFIVIIKLGDPVIIANDSLTPASLREAIFEPWPNTWGYWILGPMIALGMPLIHWRGAKFRLPLLLPLAWLFWQFVAAAHTVDARLTAVTLRHFTACVALFYLGYFGLHGQRWPWPLFVGLALAFCWIIRSGIEQHFGGLEATRRYVYSIYGATWPDVAAHNPDFAKRIESNRIFATFVYPNALAGGVLLLLPMTLVFMWQLTPKVSPLIRGGFVAVLGGTGLGVLYWSGSKAGWLVALVMVMIAVLAFLRDRLSLNVRIGLVSVFLVLGLAGFGIRFSHYFQRGATSVSARFDYWKAACQTMARHPVLGTGPGTFSRPYARLKDPKSEMARLCHNDYLEQGSDSGIIGMATFCLFVFTSIYRLYRYRIWKNSRNEAVLAALALGLVGLCFHSFVEYHLYIPALAWPLFFLLGWFWAID
jgi:O-antigen ligase